MQIETELKYSVFLIDAVARFEHYVRTFKKLETAYKNNKKTEFVSEQLAKISEQDINELVAAEVEDVFNVNKRWFHGKSRSEDVLVRIYPTLSLTVKVKDELIKPFAEDFVSVSEETNTVLRLNEYLLDKLRNDDSAWNVWEARPMKTKGSVELKCLGDYRIHEWTRLVNNDVIPFKDSISSKYDFLDPDTMAINEACADDLRRFRRKLRKPFENISTLGWGIF